MHREYQNEFTVGLSDNDFESQAQQAISSARGLAVAGVMSGIGLVLIACGVYAACGGAK